MKVLVLAGTEDGRKLATEFQQQGHQVLLSTLTSYGAELAEGEGLEVRYGALEESQISELLKEQKFDALVDATHPYAERIHALAKEVCQKERVAYCRWERPEGQYPKDSLIHWASNIEEAAHLASQLGRRIFLSTGSKNLKQWMKCPGFNVNEIFVRVLPTAEVLKQCEEVGLKPYQIIAAQGPFTRAFNKALWEQLRINVVVTKESGQTGGTEEKVQACLELKIPVIILKRPENFSLKTTEEIVISEDRVLELKKSMKNFIRKVEGRV